FVARVTRRVAAAFAALLTRFFRVVVARAAARDGAALRPRAAPARAPAPRAPAPRVAVPRAARLRPAAGRSSASRSAASSSARVVAPFFAQRRGTAFLRPVARATSTVSRPTSLLKRL